MMEEKTLLLSLSLSPPPLLGIPGRGPLPSQREGEEQGEEKRGRGGREEEGALTFFPFFLREKKNSFPSLFKLRGRGWPPPRFLLREREGEERERRRKKRGKRGSGKEEREGASLCYEKKEGTPGEPPLLFFLAW